jgi:hypothetical protein
MRLLQINEDGEVSLHEFIGDAIPPYAILSHTWESDSQEVSLQELKNGVDKSKSGYKKIRFCGQQAAVDNLQYFWIDTCCIDKSSSAELSEAINSMFRWYSGAAKCYVYLSDVLLDSNDKDGCLSQEEWKPLFWKSRWFTRGWTLQELIAPSSVEFFSVEGNHLGDKHSLVSQVHEITGIAIAVLSGATHISQFSVDERLRWAKNRETKIQEDKAYCLLGIFGIHMPLIYGEGKDNAFIRLQEEINKRLNIQSKKIKPSSTVPFRRDREFVYRAILSDIQTKCSEPAARVALVGLGGVG